MKFIPTFSTQDNAYFTTNNYANYRDYDNSTYSIFTGQELSNVDQFAYFAFYAGDISRMPMGIPAVSAKIRFKINPISGMGWDFDISCFCNKSAGNSIFQNVASDGFIEYNLTPYLSDDAWTSLNAMRVIIHAQYNPLQNAPPSFYLYEMYMEVVFQSELGSGVLAKTSSGWKSAAEAYKKVSGEWKKASDVYKKSGGVWVKTTI